MIEASQREGLHMNRTYLNAMAVFALEVIRRWCRFRAWYDALEERLYAYIDDDERITWPPPTRTARH